MKHIKTLLCLSVNFYNVFITGNFSHPYLSFTKHYELRTTTPYNLYFVIWFDW